MQSQSIENKQKYLCENILDKGYDAEEFMSFCEKNQGEINLQAWSFETLQKLTTSFIATKTTNTQTQGEIDDDEEWNDYQEPKSSPEKPNSELVFREEDWGIFGVPEIRKQIKQQKKQIQPITKPIIKEQKIEIKPVQIKQNLQGKKQEICLTAKSDPPISMSPPTSIPTQPTRKNEEKHFSGLKSEDIKNAVSKNNEIKVNGQIKISAHKAKELKALPHINEIQILSTEQKTRNFLQGDYTLYHIKFSPCNHQIQRKFNDFRKLRVILHKLYPSIRLPYLEPEGWLVNSSEGRDPETLNKYKYMIVEFLKYITIQNDTLKKSKIVRIFTGFIESNPTDFKKYEHVNKPKIFSQLCVLNGQIKFGNYETLIPIDKYMTNTHLLLGDIDTHYEKLKRNLDTLFYNYDNLNKSLQDVSNIFESLQNLLQKFNLDNNPKKDIRVYDGIQQVCLRMKDNLNSQLNIFKNRLQPLFKYERDNMGTVKQINDVRNKMFSEFIKQGLHTKNEFKIEKEAEVVGNMSIEDPVKNNKKQLCIQNMYWAHACLENMQNYWKDLRFKVSEQLTFIAYDELDTENQNLNFWNHVIKKCVI